MPGAVAKRYATALFELALDSGRVEQLDDQAKSLEGLFADARIKHFFLSPQIAALQKKQALERQLKGRIDPWLLQLLKLLIDKRRIEFMPAIMREFDVLTNKHIGIEAVTIVSAVVLTEQQREAIVAAVRRFSAYGKLEVHSEVDTGVLGGVKVRLGDNVVIDGTVSTRLRSMRERLYRYRHRGVGA